MQSTTRPAITEMHDNVQAFVPIRSDMYASLIGWVARPEWESATNDDFVTVYDNGRRSDEFLKSTLYEVW